MLLHSFRCEEEAAGVASRFVVAAFRRSRDDTTRTQEDRMNAVTTDLSHAVVYIDENLSMWRRKRLGHDAEEAAVYAAHPVGPVADTWVVLGL